MKSVNANLSLTELKSEGLRLWQPVKGYRFSIDALLLADFVQIRKRDASLLELGAGCGVISLILAKRHSDIKVSGMELQEILYACAAQNVIDNGMSHRVEIRLADFSRVEEYVLPESFDYVISNPPYRRPETGRICLDSCDALARHEILMDFNGLCRAAAYVLCTGGRFWFIYPAALTAKAIVSCRLYGLEPKRIRFVHSHSDRPARLLLLEACKGCGEELGVEPPIFLQG
ncbi:MAG: methyltransferase [Dissulfuribacterales bacterium]